MMLRHTFKNEPAAKAVEDAIDKVLEDGYRTADIAAAGGKAASTSEIGELVAQTAVELANVSYAYHAV
jgi:3-isopropylmalate dehydrogenase